MVIAKPSLESAHETVSDLLERYEGFLTDTNQPEEELIKIFLNRAESREYFSRASKFGDVMFAAIGLIGERSPLRRVMLV